MVFIVQIVIQVIDILNDGKGFPTDAGSSDYFVLGEVAMMPIGAEIDPELLPRISPAFIIASDISDLIDPVKRAERISLEQAEKASNFVSFIVDLVPIPSEFIKKIAAKFIEYLIKKLLEIVPVPLISAACVSLAMFSPIIVIVFCPTVYHYVSEELTRSFDYAQTAAANIGLLLNHH